MYVYLNEYVYIHIHFCVCMDGYIESKPPKI